MSNWLQSRQLRAGGYSGVYILVFVAILIALNYLANQYNKTFDATADKLYSLSGQTQKILDNLESPVTIYYFDQKSRFPAATNSLVRYQNASSHVSVKYVDPEADIGTAQAMNVRNFGTVMVEMNGNREEAPTTGEEDVTNAIIKLLKGGEKKACFVTGHGEADASDSERDGFSLAQTEIRNANYETETISLAETGAVPAGCTVVVVAGPSTGYFEPEVAALRTFVDGGGRLLLMFDGVTKAGEDKGEALAQLAAEWGVKAGSDVVIDMSPVGQFFGGGPLTPMISDYDTTQAITKVMGNVAALFPMTRSVSQEGANGGWTAIELMKTSPSSFSTTDFDVADGELVRKPQAETPGPISVAAVTSRDIPAAGGASADKDAAADAIPGMGDNDAKQARVVVTGSSRFARNSFFGRGGNADLFLNMMSWLSSDEDMISIRPKDPANTPMDVSQSQMRWLFFGLVLGLPLAIVIAGVRSWWVRR